MGGIHRNDSGEKTCQQNYKSRWSGLNRRPLIYETSALPLSYTGWLDDLLLKVPLAETHQNIHPTKAIINPKPCSCQAFMRH